jgi:hypothetical protein
VVGTSVAGAEERVSEKKSKHVGQAEKSHMRASERIG